jgi:hypothetical protein
MELSAGANSETLLYIRIGVTESAAAFMDKFWSIMAMPIGVLVCFGPVIILWLFSELKSPPSDNDEDRK